MIDSRTRGFRRALMAAIVGISYLAFTPLQHAFVAGVWDKGNHVIAFIVLALLLDNSWLPAGARRIPKAATLIGYGVLIECIQAFIPNRHFSLHDVVADGLGVLIYFIAISAITTTPSTGKKTDCGGQSTTATTEQNDG